MVFIPDLTRRRRSAERMDAPDLADADHEAALRGLMRINAFTNGAGLVWGPVSRWIGRRMREHAKSVPTGHPAPSLPPLRLLDIASGAGDIALSVASRAKRLDFGLSVEGVDLSPCAVRFARAQAERYSMAVNFSERDALAAPLPVGFDIFTCSLFLHHLDETAAVVLLAAMKAARPRLIVVQDLCRSRWGWLLAAWGSQLLTRSRIVHGDARLSVEGAFTQEELLRLAMEAGLIGARVVPRWPARLVLTWEAPT